VEPQNPYLAHRAEIEQAIGIICTRAHLSGADAEDFAGTVRLHVLKDDCAVLHRFKGRSSIRTYLVAVVEHCYQDWRNARWGKWRPSAEAKRTGPLGVHLERLLVRDGLSRDEAYETLRTNTALSVSRADVDRVADRLPVRTRRHFISDAVLEQRPSSEPPPDSGVVELEAASHARAAIDRLACGLEGLAPRDRLILTMRFWDECSIVAIATALQIQPKPLYRHIERLLLHLRKSLEAAGMTSEAALEVLKQRGFESSEGGALSGTRPGLETKPDARLNNGPVTRS